MTFLANTQIKLIVTFDYQIIHNLLHKIEFNNKIISDLGIIWCLSLLQPKGLINIAKASLMIHLN